jgi:Fe-S oxidoreductase
MLTATERIIFIVMLVVFGGLTGYVFSGVYKIVRSGRAAPPLKDLPSHLMEALIDVGLQRTLFRTRPILSTFHAMIFFGFTFFFLVNVTDVLEGFVPGFELVYGGEELLHTVPALTPLVDLGLINIFNLLADIFSIFVLVGMIAFIVRRFGTDDKRLKFNDDVLLHPKVQKGWVHLDSAIVGGFILFHVGSRFMGQVLRLADGNVDLFMPFASLFSYMFTGLSPDALEVGIHISWWLAIGLIVVFLPYFAISKHFHLMIAPLNLGFAKQTPRGQLDPALPAGSDDGVLAGAGTLQDLSWPRLLDAYACIMCNRCHDVCPAHSQGLSLSPSALEVNKRYLFNEEFMALAGGARSEKPLLEHMISSEAVWSCTTCFACVRVCPVGNEPMSDIIDIRRRMIIQGDEIDGGIQSALESIAKNGNWFGKGSRARAKWSSKKELGFKIKDITKEPAEYLWFVGDTASFDARVIPLTQAVARVFQYASLDYGILGRLERNSGNDVRRVGEEGLFEQLVEENMAAFGKAQFKQIFTTDPHSFNTLQNEYPQYGGQWSVHHYTTILLNLVESGQIKFNNDLSHYHGTYHDPCYLGRYNGGYSAPRKLLELMGIQFTEMPRNCENSYCCGAGGGQIWLGKTPEGERPAENRIREALSVLPTDKKVLFIVTCPKDVVMYNDAAKTTGNEDKIIVRDLIQLIEEAIGAEVIAAALAKAAEKVSSLPSPKGERSSSASAEKAPAKRKRARRSRGSAAEAVAPAEADAKPKRVRRASKEAAETASAVATPETSDVSAAEAKPKRVRRRRASKEAAETASAVATASTEDAPAEADAKPKPKRVRRRRDRKSSR